jgi:HAD superfamily hydrolase (TIGR01450 family)
VRLDDDVRGFVFDADGTLVHRAPDHVEAIPGAIEVLERIRDSGRPYAVFTNGSHLAPSAFAAEFRAAGLPIADDQVLTPLCSVRTYLERHGETAMLGFLTDPARAYLESKGVRIVENGDVADVVFVAHPNGIDFDALERAARAVLAGAPLLTGSYVPVYAGARGPVFSHGAMVTAAIAKATGATPLVVGKPSEAAVLEMERRLGVSSRDLLVAGDDVALEIALGHLGGSKTVLVRSGISGGVDAGSLPAEERPHATIETVAEMLEWL